MPGLLMGLLQFGWLGVNTFGAADYLANKGFHVPALFYPLCVLWALSAAFVGLKGIQYVARIATFLPANSAGGPADRLGALRWLRL